MKQVYRRLGQLLLLTLLAVLSACGGGSDGSKSNDASALPDKPINVVGSPGYQEVTLTWDAVPGAESYNIYWSTSPGVTKATGTKISDISGTTLITTELSSGVTYYYVVTAVSAGGESSESEETSVTPDFPMPPPPPPPPV